MAKKPQSMHVTKRPDGRWEAKKPNAKRPSFVGDTQAETKQAAGEILGNQGGGERIVHGRDGRIRDKDTIPPGNDPHPPKDTEH